MPNPVVRGRHGVAVPFALLLSSLFFTTSLAQQSAPPTASPPAPEGPILLAPIDVVAQALDAARQQIQPSLGASTYQFTLPAIESLPQGSNQPLNALILQAPGVAQDSFGQLHVRGDHANLQYRLNGVQLPEGISLFGQVLDTRLANSVLLITGALPAQYGFRTAGIIDIQTKTGTLAPGGAISMYGGSRGWLQPSIEYGGRVGQVDYFVTGEFLSNDIGIQNPTSSFNAVHDHTDQGRGLAYLSGIIDPTTRVSAIFGTSRSQLQIPNNPGQTPGLGLTVNGVTDFNSAKLNENQRELTHYGIVAVQKKVDDLDVQLSAFTRYSSVYFSPDPLGDLLYNGIAQTAYRRSIGNGLQGDGSYRLSPEHTLRAGYFLQGERSTFSTNSRVLALDGTGAQITDTPLNLPDSGGKTGWLYGLYVQDEWKIVPSVTVNFGARFDLIDQFTHEHQLSPRVNMVWQPTDNTTVHAGYARYFTAPPFELVAAPSLALLDGTTAAPTIAGNSPVKAERDHYFDIGVTQVLAPGLKVGIDGYYKIGKNVIDEGQFGSPVILTPFNYARGYAEGIELTSSYDIDRWSFYGNLAVSKAMGEKIISGEFNFAPDELAYINNHFIHLDHDQTYTASAGVSYTFTTNTRVSASLIFGTGLRTTPGAVPNGGSLPNYEQVNLSVVQKIDTGVWKGLEARLDVINLLDQKYLIRDGSGVGVGAPQYGPRRTILAGLTQRF